MFQVNKVIKFKIEDFTNFISTCSQKELIDLSDALNDSVGKMILNADLGVKLAAVEEEIDRRERNNIH